MIDVCQKQKKNCYENLATNFATQKTAANFNVEYCTLN